MTLHLTLSLLSGLAWTIVYIDCIRIGIRDRTYAMPFWALVLNLAWEGVHTVLGYRTWGLTVQISINAIWFLLDLGLLYTYLRFGRREFPAALPALAFPLWVITGLITAFAVQLAFVMEFGIGGGATYAAFLQNLLMSILFIGQLVQRNSREGQTLLIAISKWVGTLAPTVLMGVLGGGAVHSPDALVIAAGTLCSVFDLLYIGLLFRQIQVSQRLD